MNGPAEVRGGHNYCLLSFTSSVKHFAKDQVRSVNLMRCSELPKRSH